MDELSSAAISALVVRMARLRARVRSELGERPLVLPNSEFFPDRFVGDQPSLERLVLRLQEHAGMLDVPIQTRVVAEEDAVEASASSCSTGACAAPSFDPEATFERLVEHSEGWLLNVREPELHHPVALTTLLSRSLAEIFLLETQPEGKPIDQPLAVSVDLAAVELGLGVLLLEGSYVYQKACGAPRVASFTALPCPELALATALFVAHRGFNPRRAKAQLGTTQESAFSKALSWTKSNSKLIAALRDEPALLTSGELAFERDEPWFSRLLSKRSREDELLALPSEQALAAARVMASEKRAPSPKPSDDLKNLVEEALRPSHADAE